MEALSSLLRKRITIETSTETADTAGGFTTSWATFATVWAGFEPLRGRENYQDMILQSTTNYRVTIRYLAGVTTKMRIKLGGRLFNIRSIMNPEERGEMLEFMVEEGVAQ